ncbi:MAG: peptide deformylase [Candidatus Omnitrophica bacterium]|nr:peptide deformylase [Candidatus Omnitrophota bacterium]
MIKAIVKEPGQILHAKALPVPGLTPDIERLIAEMIETMHAANGVGLAANQVGSDLDILVASPDGQRGKEIVLLNARLSERGGKDRSPEGCLSVPGVSAEVTRAARVTASGLDRRGKPVTLKAQGLLAKILQHETDHLQGRLFFERLGFWRRGNLLRQYRQTESLLSRVEIPPEAKE